MSSRTWRAWRHSTCCPSSPPLRGTRRRGAAAALAILLLTAPAHALVLRDMLGHEVALPGAPARIVSLVPSVTETAFALGGEARLVGVSDFCDWPPAARAKPRVGGMINPNLE